MCGSGGLEVIPGHPLAHGREVGRSGGARSPWAVGHVSVGAVSVRGAWCGMEMAAAGGLGRVVGGRSRLALGRQSDPEVRWPDLPSMRLMPVVERRKASSPWWCGDEERRRCGELWPPRAYGEA
jgi:hypothetical protein